MTNKLACLSAMKLWPHPLDPEPESGDLVLEPAIVAFLVTFTLLAALFR